MKTNKMSLGEILDKIDTPEFVVCVMLGCVAALATFIGLSYLTSSPVISSALGLTVGSFIGYRVLLYTANLPPAVKETYSKEL